MARRNGSATATFSWVVLASISLSRGLKLVVLVASQVVACMQPDNIRPVAKIPNFVFSDDISHFQSKGLRLRRQPALEPRRFHLSHYRRSAPQIPVFRWPSRAAAGRLCLFCRKVCGFPADFSGP